MSRVTSSARGERFNPLIWPFLLSTFAYGIGFAFILPFTSDAGHSSLYNSMSDVGSGIPNIWGAVAIFTIIGGLGFLMFNISPFGKVSGLLGFMVWLFAAWCYILTGEWLVLFSVAIPNMWFWLWQYLSLSVFTGQDTLDKRTMQRYDDGEYDDDNGGRNLRETNRGVDEQ